MASQGPHCFPVLLCATPEPLLSVPPRPWACLGSLPSDHGPAQPPRTPTPAIEAMGLLAPPSPLQLSACSPPNPLLSLSARTAHWCPVSNVRFPCLAFPSVLYPLLASPSALKSPLPPPQVASPGSALSAGLCQEQLGCAGEEWAVLGQALCDSKLGQVLGWGKEMKVPGRQCSHGGVIQLWVWTGAAVVQGWGVT